MGRGRGRGRCFKSKLTSHHNHLHCWRSICTHPYTYTKLIQYIHLYIYQHLSKSIYTLLYTSTSTEFSNVWSLLCFCPKNYILFCLDVTCIHTSKNSIMRNKRLDNLNFIYRQYVELRVSCVDFKFLERLKFWAAKYKNASNILNLQKAACIESFLPIRWHTFFSEIQGQETVNRWDENIWYRWMKKSAKILKPCILHHFGRHRHQTVP